MHAHNIPDTPEVRAKIDEVQNAALATLGIDAKKVAVWEDGFRSVDELDHSFEWWYFDMHLDDGSTIASAADSSFSAASRAGRGARSAASASAASCRPWGRWR